LTESKPFIQRKTANGYVVKRMELLTKS